MTRLDDNGIPVLSRTDIEEKVESFICHFDEDCLSMPQMTPIGNICTKLAEQFGITFKLGEDLGTTGSGYRLLGRFHPSSRTISIDSSLTKGDPRFSLP